MWKKKRYDIHIRLSLEEIEAFAYAVGLFKPYEKEKYEHLAGELYWKIHNKCVEINRK